VILAAEPHLASPERRGRIPPLPSGEGWVRVVRPLESQLKFSNNLK